MKKQMFHEVPPKKKKLAIHTVLTPGKHSSKHGTKMKSDMFGEVPPLHSIKTTGSSKYGTK
jgi:hypothetical protein